MDGNLLRSMTPGNPLLRQQKIDVNNVPRSALKSIMRKPSVICEDNEPVIRLIIKDRRLDMRHVSRTDRIPVDGLFDVDTT